MIWVEGLMRIKFGQITLFENEKNMGIKIMALYFVLYPIMVIFKEHMKYWYFLFGLPIFILILIHIPRKSINYMKIVAVSIFLGVYCVNSLLQGYIRQYVYNWFGMCLILFIYCFPWILLTITENCWNEFTHIICQKTKLMFITVLMLYMHDYFMGISMNGNMQFSYAAMPAVVFSLYDFFENRKKYQLGIAGILTVMIILFGSRGPLLCIMAFIAIYFIKNQKKQIPIIIVGVLTLIYIAINYNAILNGVVVILSKYNISSRTIYKLMSGTISSDTGRSKIQDVVIGLIKKYPVFGVGIGGERIVVNREIYNMTKNMGSCYPHNIILEVLVQYGIIIGILLIIWFAVRIVVTYICEEEKRNALIILGCISIVHLMVSSSYLEEPMFFALMGMVLNYKYEENTR